MQIPSGSRFAHSLLLAVPVLLLGSIAGPTNAQSDASLGQVGEMTMTADAAELYRKPSYSPYAGRNFPTRVFWGDTHLHTANSLDARAFGATLDPEQAYRFARGEEVTSSHDIRVRLSRPLDWLVISDHSDGMGAMNEIIDGNPNLMQDPVIRDWNERLNRGGETALKATMDVIASFTAGKIPPALLDDRFARSIWNAYLKTAEQFNEPGAFSAIIGYEWTSTEDGNNLHRNVLYRDGADFAGRVLPYTTTASFNPQDLWQWMAAYEQKTGGNVLAIAHNGNLSNGLMFPVETNPATGEPLTGDYAQNRAKWEPVYEITQIKGDGEAHPSLSPNDEFADYETWDRANLGPVPKQPWMIQFEYAREALKNGLKMQATLGTNPYKFGMIGSTDSHTALATAGEENFFGKHSGVEPEPERWNHIVGEFGTTRVLGWEMVASGYAGVWATENTREALFDAFERKEVFATTGPRMLVRFFGGWQFTAEDARTRLPAEAGYSKGVPMGGELPPRPGEASPSFLVGALKDPFSGNLDRIQVVKGWVDSAGKTHERVYDVVWSGNRKPGADGKLPPVGDTVDVANAVWDNSIGAPELITAWTDPDFDPSQQAFYYARVLEIPTPRWTAYDAKRFGVKMASDVPMKTQERAYTSPIWYTPGQ
jgi:hypothetical protein